MCGRAWPAQPGREPEKQACMCNEFVRRRWLSSSQGFVPILATCTSFKKWVLAVQLHAASARARGLDRERCRISFQAPIARTRRSVRSECTAVGPLACRKIAGGWWVEFVLESMNKLTKLPFKGQITRLHRTSGASRAWPRELCGTENPGSGTCQYWKRLNL